MQKEEAAHAAALGGPDSEADGIAPGEEVELFASPLPPIGGSLCSERTVAGTIESSAGRLPAAPKPNGDLGDGIELF